MNGLAGDLSQNCPVKVGVYWNTLKYSFSDDKSKHFHCFKHQLFDQGIIPLNSISKLIWFAHLKNAHFRWENLFEGQMHVLSEQSSCIVNRLISEDNFHLFPQVDFLQLMFRGHQDIWSVDIYLFSPMLPWNSQSFHIYSKPIQFLLKRTISYHLWRYRKYVFGKYP